MVVVDILVVVVAVVVVVIVLIFVDSHTSCSSNSRNSRIGGGCGGWLTPNFFSKIFKENIHRMLTPNAELWA